MGFKKKKSFIKFFLIRGVFLVGYKVNQLLNKFNRLDNEYLMFNKHSCGKFLNEGEIYFLIYQSSIINGRLFLLPLFHTQNDVVLE